MKYISLSQLEGLLAGHGPVSYSSSRLLRAILDDCWPGLRYTVVTRVSSDAITEGRAGHFDLTSWLGKPKEKEAPDIPVSDRVIEFIKDRFREIKRQPYAKSQRHQVGWLANFAAQQDLGPLFRTAKDISRNEYTRIAWEQLPDWRMPEGME